MITLDVFLFVLLSVKKKKKLFCQLSEIRISFYISQVSQLTGPCDPGCCNSADLRAQQTSFLDTLRLFLPLRPPLPAEILLSFQNFTKNNPNLDPFAFISLYLISENRPHEMSALLRPDCTTKIVFLHPCTFFCVMSQQSAIAALQRLSLCMRLYT